MQHQHDMALPHVARSPPSGPVGGNFLGHFVKCLAQKMRQHPTAKPCGGGKGFRVARGGQPQRDRFLHWLGVNFHHHRFAIMPGERQRLPRPKPAHGGDRVQHDIFTRGKGIGAQHKIIGLPARRNRHARAPVRQVIDQRPVFGHLHRVVQGGNR